MFDDLRWVDDPRDRRDDEFRDHDDEDALSLVRGPGSTGPRGDHSGDDPRQRDADWRGLDRDRDSRDRGEGIDPRIVYNAHFEFSRGRATGPIP